MPRSRIHSCLYDADGAQLGAGAPLGQTPRTETASETSPAHARSNRANLQPHLMPSPPAQHPTAQLPGPSSPQTCFVLEAQQPRLVMVLLDTVVPPGILQSAESVVRIHLQTIIYIYLHIYIK